MKNNCNKKGKASPVKTERNTLEKQIDEMIDREKTKGKIVGKLLDLKKRAMEKFDSS
jgi:hypothetical protein